MRAGMVAFKGFFPAIFICRARVRAFLLRMYHFCMWDLSSPFLSLIYYQHI